MKFYCAYCKRNHRLYRFKYVISVAIKYGFYEVTKRLSSYKTSKTCICRKGAEAFRARAWTPVVLPATWPQHQEYFKELIQRLKGDVPDAIAIVSHSATTPKESPNWHPIVCFKCNPNLNRTCTKELCFARISMPFDKDETTCYRTLNPCCSTDGKVVWPDHTCDTKNLCRSTDDLPCMCCPLDPTICRTYKEPPCIKYKSYSDFIEQEYKSNGPV